MISSFLFLTHSVVGGAVVAAGVIALCVSKGSKPHKIAGSVYALAVCLMTPVVLIQKWWSPESVSPLGIIFVLLMGYLVLTARVAMVTAPPSIGKPTVSRWQLTAPVTAISICVLSVWFGFSASQQTSLTESAPPIEAYFFFATLAFAAACLDSLTLSKRLKSTKHRSLRHAWRMSCVLFFSTSTLFTGPGAVVLPETLRSSEWMVLPQCIVISVAVAYVIKIIKGKRRVTQ